MDLAARFDELDKDGNGVLSPDEVVDVIKDMLGSGGMSPVAKDVMDSVLSKAYDIDTALEKLSEPETMQIITGAGVPEDEAARVLATVKGVLTNHLVWTKDGSADPAMVLGRFPILRFHMGQQGVTEGGFTEPGKQVPGADSVTPRTRSAPISEPSFRGPTPWGDGVTPVAPPSVLPAPGESTGDPIMDQLLQVTGEDQ